MFSDAPPHNASARIRCADLTIPLINKGFHVEYFPPSNASIWRFFFRNRKKLIPKQKGLLEALFYFFIVLPNRLSQLFRIRNFDVVYISRGLFPYFSPFIERRIKRMEKRIIIDFDDALHLQSGYIESKPSAIRKLLINPDRHELALRCADALTVSNEYLLRYALTINHDSFILRPHINPDIYIVKEARDDATLAPVIGWMGNPSNFPLIKTIQRPLEILSEKFPGLTFHVISSEPFSYDRTNLKVINTDWRMETFAEEMSRFDIGVMPQIDTEYTKGKSGMKALEYMAGGLPVVASNIDDRQLIEDGVNGFIVSSDNEWVEKLELLITDSALRKRMGKAGREKALSHEFSLNGKVEQLIEIIGRIM